MAIEDTTKNVLNDLKIASPCPMQWGKMDLTEDQAVRFCGECRKNVYNIADMNAEDASMILQRAQAAGGSACVRLYRRADGTVITDDCPVGLRRVRDFWRRLKSSAAALALVVTALPAFGDDKGGVAAGRDAAAASKNSAASGKNSTEAGKNATAASKDRTLAPNPTPPVVPLAGAPCPPNWRVIALKEPSVKRIFDSIEAANKKPSLSFNDTIKVLRLRLELAHESERVKVPYFAMEELSQTEVAAQNLPDPSNAAERKARLDLLRDILKAQKANCNILSITDTREIDQQLKKLESQH